MNPTILQAIRSPSRAADVALALHAGWKPDSGDSNLDILGEITSESTAEIGWIAPDESLYARLPHFTESFDAARLLLPPTYRVAEMKEMRRPFSSHPHHWRIDIKPWEDDSWEGDKHTIREYGITPAMALLVAIAKIPT